MKIIMGADPAGFDLKNAIKENLLKKGYEITDIDPDSPVLFQEVAANVARGVQSKEYERGIAICGTGMGVSIICNKHRGVYAALCESLYQARRAKTVNNTNVLCMGGFIIGNEMGIEMANAWLEAEHMSGLTTEMAKIVEKEYDELVEFEKSVYSSEGEERL
ncbi:ribose 5-phosphate isomerase B [Faecalicatena contorta]|uniref:Ribose 5-phosphate isomerase B n=2 Tax=Faecalicatena contorta TaxID=39482 RepID=A0A315ZXQ4_9FIRM|nr:ribose 5-phosphate isomerase B [Faecalicatena contorta]SUQ13844.1 ribose 5-phosphate isomerase B [Faecalicatena contorta]